jgi:membrane protein DedA with SNARE-associated domain
VEAATDLILTYRYFFAFALAALDGPVASFVVGVFVASGQLEFVPTFLALLLGDLATCVVIFTFGHYFSRLPFVQRMLTKSGLAGHVGVVRHLWLEHSAKTMFMSKLAWGLSSAFLVAAGIVGLPWRRFLVLVTAVAAAQYLVLLGLAVGLGASIGPANDIFGWLKVIVAVVIAIVLIYLFVGRRVGRMLIAEEKAEERAEQADAGAAKAKEDRQAAE